MTAYIALLRGVNVGTGRSVDMKHLKEVFKDLGFKDISTYINSGNILFSSSKSKNYIRKAVENAIKKEFGLAVPALILTEGEMKRIERAVPRSWMNDASQRTDVAFLFKAADHKSLIKDMPLNRDFIDVRYTKGAVFWNIDRKHLNKSRLVKLVGHELYRYMTLRNINTVRYLAGRQMTKT